VAYSFLGVPFSPLVSDAAPRPNRTVAQTRRHIPYGNTDILDFGGLQAGTWQAKVRVDPSNAALLLSKLGLTGTLIVDDASYPGSAMTKCEGHYVTVRREYDFFEVEFVIP
jgi:hypothetical protein